MYIILRLSCENMRKIAVKISFLWGREHGVDEAVLFAESVTSWCLSNDMHNFTSIILYMIIIRIAQWLADANIEIWH